MPDTSPSSDRYFDLSLRLLTAFVLVALVCCIGFLSYRWLGPRLPLASRAPAEPARSTVVAPEPAASAAPAPADEVLMDPSKTFRCIEQGRVTFSDHACDSGSELLLPSHPSQQTQPGH